MRSLAVSGFSYEEALGRDEVNPSLSSIFCRVPALDGLHIPLIFCQIVWHIQGGLAATCDLAAFSGFCDRPSKEICQSFENHCEHAQNENVTSKMFRRHFCSGFAFDSINVLFALSTFW